MYLSAVTLCPLTKKATVMLQCFDHIILRLAYGDIFRDQTSHLVPTQDDLLTLIWFFLAHNGGHHLWRELALRKELPHTDGLVMGGRTLVQVDFLYHIPLAALVQIGQLHRRAHLDSAIVHKVKQFGDKIGKADISLNLCVAICAFGS